MAFANGDTVGARTKLQEKFQSLGPDFDPQDHVFSDVLAGRIAYAEGNIEARAEADHQLRT